MSRKDLERINEEKLKKHLLFANPFKKGEYDNPGKTIEESIKRVGIKVNKMYGKEADIIIMNDLEVSMKNEKNTIKKYEDELISNRVNITYFVGYEDESIDLYCNHTGVKFIIKEGRIYKNNEPRNDDDCIRSTFILYNKEMITSEDEYIGKTVMTLEEFICNLIESLESYKRFKRYY